MKGSALAMATRGTAQRSAKKAATKNTATKKTAAKKTAAKAATKTATSKRATKKTATKKTATKKTATNKTAPKASAMLVRADEKPWTAKELADLRKEIEADIAQLEQQIAAAQAGLLDLLQDAGDGAGDDQADAGTKTFEREQEISLANNARELLEQNRRARERMDDGTYGVCENCGNPIGKLRLQAAPRATLCMPCKTKQERR